ncbi:hypothetical protein FUAX_23460 [Fulvitalea axinellae]|uniref:Uncharacterized protein n=1 Tax=Fulvitalea axinellae TaxID=1182444 RepID=A0AAU9CCS0_9BACT|nr:hypothetical protein FUAX_23460 [Fulvitalea axinellae]
MMKLLLFTPMLVTFDTTSYNSLDAEEVEFLIDRPQSPGTSTHSVILNGELFHIYFMYAGGDNSEETFCVRNIRVEPNVKDLYYHITVYETGSSSGSSRLTSGWAYGCETFSYCYGTLKYPGIVIHYGGEKYVIRTL